MRFLSNTGPDALQYTDVRQDSGPDTGSDTVPDPGLEAIPDADLDACPDAGPHVPICRHQLLVQDDYAREHLSEWRTAPHDRLWRIKAALAVHIADGGFGARPIGRIGT